jgi:aminoglycoside phosphotransferase (APT) family kinase protein
MTRSVQLEGLHLIARGGQADIYELSERKVLRVGRRPQDVERIAYEYSVYSCLAGTDVTIPKAYELVEAGGLPAIIMERLEGPSMMDQIRADPLTAKAKARELAELHLEIGKINAPEQITDVKAKAKFCIGKSEALSEPDKEKILDVLKLLPEGTSLCHGDFHPGNIMVQGNRNYVIDWSAASRGDFHADVAHSYILMRVVPKVPHMNSMMHFIQKRIGRAIANTYLSTVRDRVALDSTDLSRWMLINAAERTYYGMPSERKDLLAFIGRYLDVLQRGGDEGLLYKAM